MSGSPGTGPVSSSTSVNWAGPSARYRSAKCRATASWWAASTETPNVVVPLRQRCITAPLPTHTSNSGGSSDTEVKELAVMPCGTAPPVVITVTPVANAPNACRSALASRTSGSAADGWTCTLTSWMRVLGHVRLKRADQGLGDPRGRCLGVGAAHAGHPLPAAGDEALGPVGIQADVVEAELQLRLGQLDQAHPNGQLVEGGDLGEELAVDLEGEQLEVVLEVGEHVRRPLLEEHLPATALPALVVAVVDAPHDVRRRDTHRVEVLEAGARGLRPPFRQDRHCHRVRQAVHGGRERRGPAAGRGQHCP